MNRKEFKKWLEWHQKNMYEWAGKEENLVINGHSISTKCSQFHHIVIDNILVDISENCTYIVDNVQMSTIDYVLKKIYG